MTSNNDDRKITISLEVTIPCDRQIDASEVAVRGAKSKGCAKSQSPEMVHGPQTGQEWKVKIYGSGPGVICAYGDGHEDAERVLGQCYPPDTSPDPLPPSGADQATISNDFWLMSQVPGAVVGSCTLRVWYYDGDELVFVEDVPFTGIASTHTECEGSVTGLATAPVKRVFFPNRLTAVAQGFSEEVGFFNGTWAMDVKPCIHDVDRLAWRTADSPSGVVVELVSDLQDESAALSFRKGATEIRYHKAAGEWNATNVCDFANVTSRAVPPATAIPAIIQVHPGAES